MFKLLLDIDQTARVCHEANRGLCAAIGDDSQVTWELAEDWQKNSARAGVHSFLENPHQTAEQTHEKWSEFKRNDGWVFGAQKDAAAKTHPCLVPYADLPAEQRYKDVLFRAIVTGLSITSE